jgi:hypothetical protein
MIIKYEFKYLTPEWICRARRTAFFLEVTYLTLIETQSNDSEELIDVIRKHMQIDHLSILERNGELFVLNEPYGDHALGVQGLIAQGLSVIKVPINLAPYCGKFSSEKDSRPWTTSYLISAKQTMTSQDIAERLELADVFAPAWNT